VLITIVTGFISTGSAEVLKIRIDDTINPITDEYIGRAIQSAEQNKDSALVMGLIVSSSPRSPPPPCR